MLEHSFFGSRDGYRSFQGKWALQRTGGLSSLFRFFVLSLAASNGRITNIQPRPGKSDGGSAMTTVAPAPGSCRGR